MITVSLRFIAGRYHATPWGRHVNEGAVEWPPSPWRILRALVATWKRTLPDVPRERVEPILRALLQPPEFVLPVASTGHTRHYMPWFKKGPDDRTLVFDTFVAVARSPHEKSIGPHPAPLVVCWPNASLESTQRGMMSAILVNLSTLGRAESWCEAELTDDVDRSGPLVCRPLEDGAASDQDIVRLLCPDPATALSDDAVVRVTMKTIGRGKEKATVEQRSSPYDPTWNLCMETLQLHDERWSDPPGSRWVAYARPRDCFRIEPRPRRSLARPAIQVIRFALDSEVLPSVTEILPIAEAARRALMGIHGQLTEKDGVRGRSDILSGKDSHDRPLAGHTHAYYLPTDEDGDGRLDHLTVFAAGGLGSDERRAADRLRRLRTGREGEDRHPLRLLLLGMGGSGDYRPGPLRASRVWISATPYLATRYAKIRGRHRIDIGSPNARSAFLHDDILAQLIAVRPDLASEASPAVTIEPIWDGNQVFKVADRWRTIQFKRFRRRRGDDGGRRLAGAFRLTFRRPVHGPIALGWSSHFGMGLFVPAKQEELE